MQPPTACIITTTAQPSSAENQPRSSQGHDQESEEALRKKGRLLLQHLQNLDAKLNSSNSGSGTGHPMFTTISFPRNLLPTPRGNILTSNFTPPQVQGASFPQTVSSNLLPPSISQGPPNPSQGALNLSRQNSASDQAGPS